MNAPTPTPAAARTAVPRETLFLATLAVISGLTPLSIDMYLPAMPVLQTALHATQGEVQFTLSAYMLGFAVGILFWGPIGDRLGRRGPMMAGLGLYALASAGCAMAGAIEPVIAFRVLQALGGCAVATLAQASVADVYERNESARALSLMQLVFLGAPLLAPLIGGVLLTAFGWRSIFWTLALFAVLSVGAVASLPDTLPSHRRVRAPVLPLIAAYFRIAANRRYLAYALNNGCVSAGMFAYIAGTPFIYIKMFHVPPQAFGLLFGMNVVGMLASNIVNRRLVGRLGSDAMLRIGVSITAVSGVLLLIAALAGLKGPLGLVSLVVPIFGFVSCLSMIGPNAAAGAMSLFRERAGAASALFGATSMSMGAISTATVGALANGTALPMATVMCVMGLAALGINLMALRGRAAG